MKWRNSLGTGLFSLVLAAGLCAAEAAPPATSGTAGTLSETAKSPAAKPAPPTPAPAAAKPEEALLFTVTAGKRQVLGRMDPLGLCKVYLGRQGEGWQAFPDPKATGNDYQAVSSPDGKHLALLSSRNGALNVWLLSADAREWRLLTDDDAGVVDAAQAEDPILAFSPDSKHLAMVIRGSLWLSNLDNEAPRTLTRDPGVRSLAWSPDGLWLAYLVRSSVRKVQISGHPDILLSTGLANDLDLAWHPDPKAEKLYFLGLGLRSVDARRRVALVAPSSSVPNDIAVVSGGKTVALLAPAAGGRNEIHTASLEKSGALMQVTQEGADSVLPSSSGKSLYFIRDGVAWRCDNDGRKARSLGAVKLRALRTASLPPLKGVCP